MSRLIVACDQEEPYEARTIDSSRINLNSFMGCLSNVGRLIRTPVPNIRLIEATLRHDLRGRCIQMTTPRERRTHKSAVMDGYWKSQEYSKSCSCGAGEVCFGCDRENLRREGGGIRHIRPVHLSLGAVRPMGRLATTKPDSFWEQRSL